MKYVNGAFVSWPSVRENTKVEGASRTAIVASFRAVGIRAVCESGLVALAVCGLLVDAMVLARNETTVGL